MGLHPIMMTHLIKRIRRRGKSSLELVKKCPLCVDGRTREESTQGSPQGTSRPTMPTAWRASTLCNTLVSKLIWTSRNRDPFFVVAASKRKVSGIFLSTNRNASSLLKSLWGSGNTIGRLQVASLLETSSVFEFRGEQRRLRWWTPASQAQAPRAVLAGLEGDIATGRAVAGRSVRQ